MKGGEVMKRKVLKEKEYEAGQEMTGSVVDKGVQKVDERMQNRTVRASCGRGGGKATQPASATAEAVSSVRANPTSSATKVPPLDGSGCSGMAGSGAKREEASEVAGCEGAAILPQTATLPAPATS